MGPGSAYVASVSITVIVAGSAEDFDSEGMQDTLLLKYPKAFDVELQVTSGSAIVDISMLFFSLSAAEEAVVSLSTSPENLSLILGTMVESVLVPSAVDVTVIQRATQPRPPPPLLPPIHIDPTSIDPAAIAGIIVGVVGGVCVLGILFVVLLRRLFKTTRAKYDHKFEGIASNGPGEPACSTSTTAPSDISYDTDPARNAMLALAARTGNEDPVPSTSHLPKSSKRVSNACVPPPDTPPDTPAATKQARLHVSAEVITRYSLPAHSGAESKTVTVRPAMVRVKSGGSSPAGNPLDNPEMLKQVQLSLGLDSQSSKHVQRSLALDEPGAGTPPGALEDTSLRI